MTFDDDNQDDDFFPFESGWDPENDDDFDPDWEPDGEFSLSSDLEEAERQIRIDQMKEEIKKRRGSWESTPELENLPPEAEEAILHRVLFFETAPRTSYAKMLIEDGIELPSPDTLTMPELLHAKLWEVIHGLAHRRVFLHCTNHLDDLALYSRLWFQDLNYETVDISWDVDAGAHLDLLGSGSSEDTLAWLRFFADEEEREWWRDTLEAQGEVLPDHVDPLHDRDQLLPKREEF